MPDYFSVLKTESSLGSLISCVFSCVGDTTIKKESRSVWSTVWEGIWPPHKQKWTVWCSIKSLSTFTDFLLGAPAAHPWRGALWEAAVAHILALIMAPALEFLFYPASTTAEEQWSHNRKKTEQGERSALSKGNRSRHGQFPNLKLFLENCSFNTGQCCGPGVWVWSLKFLRGSSLR